MIHLLVLCRLATIKAQDKLQALVNSSALAQLSIVRHRPVPLQSERVLIHQRAYLPDFPDTVHSFTPRMRLQNHVMMLWTAFWAIRAQQPEAIYAIFLMPYGLFAWLLSRWYKRPCLISLIGTDLNDYTLRRFTAPFFKWMLTQVEVITVVDEDARTRLLAGTRVRPENVMILPNAVDLSAYMAIPPGQKRDYEAIYVGRLLDMKEPENLLYTWAEIIKHRPGSRLLILGDGPMRLGLQALAQELGLGEQVQFLGWVAEVAPWVHRSKLFLSLSSQEGVPMAMIEAMAGGAVPIHTRVGGVPSVLRHGENGFLVDYPTQIPQVSAYILEALGDEGLYAALQAEALRVSQTFGLAPVTAAWEQILRHPNLKLKAKRTS